MFGCNRFPDMKTCRLCFSSSNLHWIFEASILKLYIAFSLSCTADVPFVGIQHISQILLLLCDQINIRIFTLIPKLFKHEFQNIKHAQYWCCYPNCENKLLMFGVRNLDWYINCVRQPCYWLDNCILDSVYHLFLLWFTSIQITYVCASPCIRLCHLIDTCRRGVT